jgi:putative transposon-encoded protein
MKLARSKNTIDEANAAGLNQDSEATAEAARNMVKFEVFGQEMLEKEVKLSGNSGRVYLPPDWVGHRVKIIRID